jgi:hypothetical protein
MHFEYFKFIATKTYESCGRSRRVLTHAEYAEALDCMVLVVAPDTSPEFGLSGPRHGKND